MTSHDRPLSRRDFFSRLIPGREKAADPTPVAAPPAAPAAPPPAMVAVIAGRHCLAYQNSFCSTCRERCPVPGAIVIERGIPRVDPVPCTGCRVCHDVCPAPTNAIRLVPRPAGLPPIPAAITAGR